MSLATATVPTLPSLGVRLSPCPSHQTMLTFVALGLPLAVATFTKKTFNHQEEVGPRGLRTSVKCGASKSERLVTSTLKEPRIALSPLQSKKMTRRVNQVQSAAAVCASAFDIRCAVAEPQTISRKSSSTTIVSHRGKETLPMLDSGGGSGFRGNPNDYKPYYRGDGSGGGGSGGGGGGRQTSREFPWGDFWFYLFLCLLHFLIRTIIEGKKNKRITGLVSSPDQAAYEWKKFEEEQRNWTFEESS